MDKQYLNIFISAKLRKSFLIQIIWATNRILQYFILAIEASEIHKQMCAVIQVDITKLLANIFVICNLDIC